MKRIIWAVLLIGVVGGLYTFHILNLNRVYNESHQYLSKMKKQFNKKQYVGAEFTANEFENSWDKNENVLDYFVSQDQLEEIRITISEMPHLANQESKEFISHIEMLDSMFNHLKEKESFKLY